MANIGFAPGYTNLYQVENEEGQKLYLGPGISTVEQSNEDETDDTAYYDGGGAQAEDVTGVKLSYEFEGHRYYGDPAQDFIASLKTKYGEGRVVPFYHTAPDGSVLKGKVTVRDIVTEGGEANEKGTISFTATFRQMPTVVPPQSKHLPESISFDEGPHTVNAGEKLDLGALVKVVPDDATPNCVFSLDDASMDAEDESAGTAIIDSAGMLVAKGEGKVMVTAKCVSKPSANATVEVTINPAAG